MNDRPVVRAHERLDRRRRDCFGVLVELAQVLEGSWENLCVVGGWAVYMLTEVFLGQGEDVPLRHRGSMDVDIGLGTAQVSVQQGEALASALRGAGYIGPEGFRWLRRSRENTYRLDLMALPPPGHEGGPVVVGDYEFAPLWYGDALFAAPVELLIEGEKPTGEMGRGRVRVASPGGLLVVKAWTAATLGREPDSKHLYDIFVLLRTYPGGPEGFVREVEPLRASEALEGALGLLQALFVEGDNGIEAVVAERANDPRDPELLREEARVTVERFLEAVAAG